MANDEAGTGGRRGRAVDGETGGAGGAGGGGRGRGSDRGMWLGIIGVLLLAVVAVYAWSQIRVGQARGDAEAERRALVERAERATEARTRELLRLSALPLGWVVRTEMVRRNLDAVDGYLADFVGEPGVEAAVVAGVGDSILVAGDRQWIGRPFSERFPAELLLSDTVAVESGREGLLRVVVPILGTNRRLGTLVVAYRPEELGLGSEPGEAGADASPAGERTDEEPAGAGADAEPAGAEAGDPAGG